jgi:pimeloyl-ACP methyl ester carboxylesterase
MAIFELDQIRFRYRETGLGLPFVFQHGLGGSLEQPFGLFSPPDGIRMIAMDSRGHGQTTPLGPVDGIRLGQFADDVIRLLDHLHVAQAVVGGISMGAAVALNLTLRFPDRVRGLVLSRPAWLAQANPRNTVWFGEIARLIHEHGAQQGKQRFRDSAMYHEVLAESTDVAQSMLNQFDSPRAEETVVILERLRGDAPCQSLDELAHINVPTLVLANQQDPVHPFEYGRILAHAIPGAQFAELTPKSQSLARHQADLQQHLERFLQTRIS